MFFVINKEKLVTYIISITAVVMLFCIGSTFNNLNTKKQEDTVQTDSKIMDEKNTKNENNSKK